MNSTGGALPLILATTTPYSAWKALSNASYPCAAQLPLASQILNADIPVWAQGVLALFTFFAALSIVVFVDEVVFLVKKFKPGARLHKTIWILSLFPMYSLTSYLAVLVPRSGTLINLVANTILATVLYQFIGLMTNYLGGPEKMWTLFGETREIGLNTAPCCCCCPCLPKKRLTRKLFQTLHYMVLQLIIVRPSLMFIAAILWTNNSYVPGDLLPNNAFLYISVTNLISSLVAMWGIMILRGAFRPELEQNYRISGKIGCVQLAILFTSVINIIIGILVTANVITCNGLMSSKGRADGIYHEILIILMSLMGVMSRFYYRRETDSLDMVFLDTTSVNAGDMVFLDNHSEISADGKSTHKEPIPDNDITAVV